MVGHSATGRGVATASWCFLLMPLPVKPAWGRGHAFASAVDSSRHGGTVNVLFIDGVTKKPCRNPRTVIGGAALRWENPRW